MVTNFLNGLLHSNLVIDGHHGHQGGVRTDGGLQQLQTQTQSLQGDDPEGLVLTGFGCVPPGPAGRSSVLAGK